MRQSTAQADRRPSSLFQPGGLKWVAMPDIAPGAGQVVLAGILRLVRRGTETWAPDWEIAVAAGCSARLVQKGLKELESARWIVRKRRRGTRKITLLFRLAGQCTHSHDGAAPIRTGVLHLFAPSGETLKTEERRETNAGSPARPPEGRSDEPADENVRAVMDRFFGRAIAAKAKGDRS